MELPKILSVKETKLIPTKLIEGKAFQLVTPIIAQLITEQRASPNIRILLKIEGNNEVYFPGDAAAEDGERTISNSKRLTRMKAAAEKNYTLAENGVLLFKANNHVSEISRLIVIPATMASAIFELCHAKSLAHFDFKRSMAFFNQFFMTPMAVSGLRTYIQCCKECNLKRATQYYRTNLGEEYHPSLFGGLIGGRWTMDLLKFKRDIEGHVYLLLLIDTASSFVIPMYLKDKKGETVALALYRNFLTKFRINVQKTYVGSDRGPEFINTVVELLWHRFSLSQW